MSSSPTSLRALSNAELLNSTSRLAADERKITLSVIEHFREVERRKAYSDLGYASLPEYAVKHLHYSEASASRRIAAMWALRDCPELATRIESGEVNVTTVARIQTTIRRDERLTGSKWDGAKKTEAYREMGSLSVNALERRLIEISPLAAVRERVKLVAPEVCEVTLHLTPEDVSHLETLRGAFSHELKNASSNSELVRRLIKMGIGELERKRNGPAWKGKLENRELEKSGLGKSGLEKTRSERTSPMKHQTKGEKILPKTKKKSHEPPPALTDAGIPPLSVNTESILPCATNHEDIPPLAANN